MSLRDGSRVDTVVTEIEIGPFEPEFYLKMTAAQASEISFGRVPEELKDAARLLVDETHLELRKNAAKPVRLAKQKGASRRG
jgi:uncharacterized iron-regulated protein